MNRAESILHEIGLLKEKQAALQDVLDEKYKELEVELSSSKLTRFSVGNGKEAITARLKRSSKFILKNADGLLGSISDPLQFARVLLHTLTITKKVIQALEQVGVPASTFFTKKEGKAYLEVSCGKQSLLESRIQESKSEYYQEVDRLRKELQDVAVDASMKRFLRDPVFPSQTPLEKLAKSMEGE